MSIASSPHRRGRRAKSAAPPRKCVYARLDAAARSSDNPCMGLHECMHSWVQAWIHSATSFQKTMHSGRRSARTRAHADQAWPNVAVRKILACAHRIPLGIARSPAAKPPPPPRPFSLDSPPRSSLAPPTLPAVIPGDAPSAPQPRCSTPLYEYKPVSSRNPVSRAFPSKFLLWHGAYWICVLHTRLHPS